MRIYNILISADILPDFGFVFVGRWKKKINYPVIFFHLPTVCRFGPSAWHRPTSYEKQAIQTRPSVRRSWVDHRPITILSADHLQTVCRFGPSAWHRPTSYEKQAIQTRPTVRRSWVDHRPMTILSADHLQTVGRLNSLSVVDRPVIGQSMALISHAPYIYNIHVFLCVVQFRPFCQVQRLGPLDLTH